MIISTKRRRMSATWQLAYWRAASVGPAVSRSTHTQPMHMHMHTSAHIYWDNMGL